jgi:hypothetical protein
MYKIVFCISLIINLRLLYKPGAQIFRKTLQQGKQQLKRGLTFLGYYSPSVILQAPLVYRMEQRKTFILQEIVHQSDAKLLPETLVIAPGFYTYRGKIYDMTHEGLYRIVFPHKKDNQQRIVYQAKADIFLSSLAWMLTHGHRDDALNHQQLMKKALSDKLILTCESAVRFAHGLLAQSNILSRVIGVRTLEVWNGYDDGHYLLEVYQEDIAKWVLYDLDMDVYFSYQNNPLSLLEFKERIATSDYQIDYISQDIRAMADDYDLRNYNYAFANELRLTDLYSWYKRLIQFSFIEKKEGCFSFNRPKIDAYPRGAFPFLHYLSKEEFIRDFY